LAKAAVPALIAAMQAGNNVSGAASRALGEIGPAAHDAIPALEKLLKELDNDPFVARTLQKIRGK